MQHGRRAGQGLLLPDGHLEDQHARRLQLAQDRGLVPAQRAGWVETCFESYGRDASGSSEYDPAKTIALCLQAGPNASRLHLRRRARLRQQLRRRPGGVPLLRGRAGPVPAALLRGHRDDPRRDAPLRRRAAARRATGDAGALPGRLLPRRRDHVVLGGLAARASLWNRRRKLALFMETMQPGPETRVVDVGVGDTGFGTEPGVASSHNFFEALYPWPERITAVSDVPLPNFAREFPTVSTVTASGTELPFEDDAFDVAFSNAVVEHVGGRGRAAPVRRRALPGGAARLPLDAEPLVPGRDAHARAVRPLAPTAGGRPSLRRVRAGQLGAGPAAEQAPAPRPLPAVGRDPGRRVPDHDQRRGRAISTTSEVMPLTPSGRRRFRRCRD